MSAVQISSDEFASRRASAAAMAAERGLDALIVWSRNGTTVDWYGDVLYLANHHTPFPQLPDNLPLWSGRSHSVLVLPVEGDPVLALDTVEYREDLVEVSDVRVGLNLPAVVAGVLRERGLDVAKLGLVGRESLLLSTYQLLCSELGRVVELTPCDDILESLRRRKSDAELALMREAALIGIECMSTMLEAVQAGRTEGDIAGEGWRAAARRGAFPYDIAISSGPHSEQFQWARLPSWDHQRKLENGDLIHIDLYGPAVEGYWTDFTRSTIVGGYAADAERELLDGAVALVESVIDGIRPGATFGELWERGQRWRTEHGFATTADGARGVDLEAMLPGFGHCVGLAGAEPPYVTRDTSGLIEERMVIAIETLVSRPGVGGAGFEQDVIVTADACEVITQGCPARWWRSREDG